MWHIIALGKIKPSPEKQLCDEYVKRCKIPVKITELEEKKNLSGDALKEKEALLILKTIPKNAYLFALDERGKTFPSPEFAKKLQSVQSDMTGDIYFVIGGAFGLHPSVRQRANMVISFGAMTFPHMIVRALLTEQLYRAQQIMNNHPYHKQ